MNLGAMEPQVCLMVKKRLGVQIVLPCCGNQSVETKNHKETLQIHPIFVILQLHIMYVYIYIYLEPINYR